jgi:hypothetical protein
MRCGDTVQPADSSAHLADLIQAVKSPTRDTTHPTAHAKAATAGQRNCESPIFRWNDLGNVELGVGHGRLERGQDRFGIPINRFMHNLTNVACRFAKRPGLIDRPGSDQAGLGKASDVGGKSSSGSREMALMDDLYSLC